jgi:hypothetical protein
MSVKQQLIQEIDTAPDFLLTEVLEFFLFLKIRLAQREEKATSPRSTYEPRPMFLQVAQEINHELMDEDSSALPPDFSRNLDHYLYGFPKVDA